MIQPESVVVIHGPNPWSRIILRIPMKQLAALAVGASLLMPVAPHAASRAPVRAAKGMVGSAEEHASRVGVDILRKGGNAVDAAVAVGFALAVTHPSAGNIGGGGLMLIRFSDGRATAIDYREMAPGRAHRDMFLDEKGNPVAARSLVGPLAAGVPGSVAGLAYAQKMYGKLTLADTLAPAIALADSGFEISDELSHSLAGEHTLFERFPETAKILLKNGRPYEPGERLIQKDLAATLKAIAADGPDAFYRGRIAELIASEMARSGGLITKEDLAAYKPVERQALRGTYRGYGILGMPPISSGGIALIQFLNILEAYPIGELGHNSSRTIHLVAEAAKRVYADRSEWLGDPAFFRVPVGGLISKRYAERLRAGIRPDKATPSSSIKPGAPAEFESDQTTHYSVVDADGTAVSTTTTLNGSYGNGQIVTGGGFLLNNEMDDFSAKPGSPNMFGLIGGRANEIAPHKRMLSSMTPTIVTKDDRTFLVVGSPGGSRIITTVLQVIMNVIDYEMNVQEAVDAPRFHHQWVPDEIGIERRGFPLDVIRALEALGHKTKPFGDMGDVHAIVIDLKTGARLGASDPRNDGRTVGY
jgi:gamma-glutamyltranspeptidase / glutathione hydrolase